MRLTTFSDYSLRVLIYLGLRQERLVTITDIADAYGISKNHLMKVVHQLALAGYVETVRGKGGGIRLKKPPAKISIGAVVRDFEQESVLVECFDIESSQCRIDHTCVLRGLFHQAMEAFFKTLDRYTLADLLKPEKGLAFILFVEHS